MSVQTDLFDTAVELKPPRKKRAIDHEAKLILEKAGVSQLPRETKALIAAKLMREWFPEMHKTMLLALATTSIKPQ